MRTISAEFDDTPERKILGELTEAWLQVGYRLSGAIQAMFPQGAEVLVWYAPDHYTPAVVAGPPFRNTVQVQYPNGSRRKVHWRDVRLLREKLPRELP